MPINSKVLALIRNRKYGVAIKHVTEKIRKTNPDVAQIFDELANGLNDVYRTMAQPTALQDLVIVDPSGRKIIELNPNGTITVQDASGHQVALLGDVVETPLSITAATAANPSVLTVPGNTYENGDTIEVIGALGTATRVTYRIVQNVGIAGSGTFTTTDLNGTPLAGSGAYAGGATATRYYGGLLAETIAIGESFADYKLRAFADGSLKIKNAEFTLTSGGVTVSINGDLLPPYSESGILVEDGSDKAVMIPNAFILLDNANQIVAQIFGNSLNLVDPATTNALIGSPTNLSISNATNGDIATVLSNSFSITSPSTGGATVSPNSIFFSTAGIGETSTNNLTTTAIFNAPIFNASGVYEVGGTQVVGPRQPSVTPPSGGSTIDTEARAAINEIISRLQGHGLIS